MSRLNIFKSYVKEGTRCFFIMSAGDLIAQTFIEKKPLKELDAVRTIKFGTLGFVLVGPSLKFWYGRMDRIVSSNQKPITRALKKMCLDQLLFAPPFTAFLMSVIAATNSESMEQIKNRLYQDYPQVMLRGYMLWPAAQIINFTIMPLSYQVVFVQIVAVIWNCYMSLVLNKSTSN